jgi:hypothetical protein
MIVGIEGQYVFIFTLGDQKGFILEEDLIDFTLSERAGNILPIFSLTFRTKDKKIERYLNEGNELIVSLGREQRELSDVKLLILKSQIINESLFSKTFTVKGITSHLSYKTTKTRITNKIPGSQALKEVAGKHFIVDSNLSETDDAMNWIQPGISDRKFIQDDIWMYTYIPDSFLAIGISSDSRFIIRDVKKRMKEDYDWRLTPFLEKDNDINYDGDFINNSNNGLINAFMGYERFKLVYDIEEGEIAEINEEIKPLMALTKKLIRNAEEEKRYAEIGIINENVHKNYHRAYLRNMASLSLFSTKILTCSYQSMYKPNRVLDTVFFYEVDSDGLAEHNSGLYLTSKVTRQLGNKTFKTKIDICRESINQPAGNLK